jgi:hypothetical protein
VPVPVTIARRTAVAALAVAAALAAVPAGARADAPAPMTEDQIYTLTCGHLGVPCAAPARPHGQRRARAAGARHLHAGRKASGVRAVGR